MDMEWDLRMLRNFFKMCTKILSFPRLPKSCKSWFQSKVQRGFLLSVALLYVNGSGIGSFIRCVLAYKQIENNLDDEDFDNVLDYFEEYYIGKLVCGRSKTPRLAVEQ